MGLPFTAIALGTFISCTIGSKLRCPEIGVFGTILSLAAVFVFGGVCSFVGGILLFVAAANPPPPDVFNPQGYSAFAAIAGIMAVVAGITYCFGLCCYAIKQCLDNKSIGQKANSEG